MDNRVADGLSCDMIMRLMDDPEGAYSLTSGISPVGPNLAGWLASTEGTVPDWVGLGWAVGHGKQLRFLLIFTMT